MTSPSRLTRLIAAGLALGSIGIASATSVLAQNQNQTRRSRVKFTMPRLSYDRGAPSKRGEGGSRNNFCESPIGPIALTPQYSEARLDSDGNPLLDLAGQPRQQYFVLTQTNQPQPTFGLYMPIAQSDVADLKLNLFVVDEAGNELYDLPIPAPSEAGIMTFQPGKNQAALEEGQRYNWAIEIEVACTENDLNIPKYATLQGQIERHPIFEEDTLMSKEEYARVAAEKGFWPDAMAIVADLHRQNRSNEQYLADWAALLEAIDLGQLTTAPLSNVTQLLPPQAQANTPTPNGGIPAQLPRPASRLFPVR